MTKEATWIGVILVIGGILLLTLTKFNIVGVIYGISAIVIGISIIIFNKEDKIEERKDITKDLKHTKSKK